MASILVTEEMLEKESLEKSKNSIKDTVNNENFIKEEIIEEVEKEIKQDIPSEFICVNLASNGRIDGVPKSLHFRAYSSSDALDISSASETDKPKVIANVLTRMNYENFDCKKLTVEDTLYILYILQNNFISPTIEKTIYIDDTIEDEEKLESEDNKEIVTIPISSINYQLLGKDVNDKDIEPMIKIPFKITDKTTKNYAKFKFLTMEDMIKADLYCRKYFNENEIRFAPIEKEINRIKMIEDEKERDEMLDKFILDKHEECEAYYEYVEERSKMIFKVLQALQIVEYNGEKLEKIEDCWEVYTKNISDNIWKLYDKTIKSYPFGLLDEVTVYSNKLKKKITRRVGFQLSEFLRFNYAEELDRYDVTFD